MVSRRLMFFFGLIFFFSSFISFRRPIVTKTRDTDPIKQLCKSTGHFEYVYKDKYFYNSYEWTRKEKIVYFFHRYFINTVLYLCDEMWFYEVWNNCFSFFLFSFGLLFSMLLNFNLEQMHLVVDRTVSVGLSVGFFASLSSYWPRESSTLMLRKLAQVCTVIVWAV